MSKHFLKLILAGLLFASGTAFAQIGQYRGQELSEQIFSERMFGTPNAMKFSKYLSSMSGNALYSILDLLGTYRTNDGQHVFRNGQPNTVNMLLWYMVLNAVAGDISSNCNLDTGLPLTPSFRESLLKICQWPADEAKQEATMQNFWLSLMSYDAPESEYQAWREFFLNSSYQSRPGPATVHAMVLAIVYNPHFLLRK